MQAFAATVEQVLQAMPLFATVFALVFAAKWMFQKTTRYCIDDELTEKDNPAFGIAFGGYIVGVAIALSGALYPWEGADLVEELLSIMLYGLIAAALMRLSVWINDRAILHSFPIEKELVDDRNPGTGFVVAGSSIATGFMLRGVLAGFSDSLLTGLRDVAVYFVVGQVILVAGGWVYTRMAGYDVHHEIGNDDNTAAGISFGGYLAALGYIASVALTGATSAWVDEVITAFIVATFGIALLMGARVVADLLLLPKSPLAKEVAEDANVAAGVAAAASFLIVAILFGASLHLSSATAPGANPAVGTTQESTGAAGAPANELPPDAPGTPAGGAETQ